MKDIIKDLPETFLIDEFPQGHVQDGMVRWLADDSFDEKQSGVRYAAIDTPVMAPSLGHPRQIKIETPVLDEEGNPMQTTQKN